VLASSAQPCAPPTDCPADETNTTLSSTTSYRSSTAYWYRIDASAGVNIQQRRGVRVALEQVRYPVRDITENQPYTDDAPVRDVLARTAEVLTTHRTRRWLSCSGFSVRRLPRWLAQA